MLQKLREQTQGTAFKVLVGIIIFVLAVFGFGALNLFVGGEPDMASVNGEGISQSDLGRAVELERRRIAARMGDQFDANMIDSARLQNGVLDQLIARELMEQAADELGVLVSDDRVNEMLVDNEAFHSGGVFNADMYRQAVQAMGFTPQGFMDDTARLMALEQLQSALTGTAFLTQRELNLHAGLLGQRRNIAYLPFDVDRFRSQVNLSDDDVKLRYDENERDYRTEETVDVAYLTLSLDDLLKDPSVEVSEDDVRNVYEADRDAAPQGEERRSRHILLTHDERSAEEAKATLEELRGRIEQGESFEELAREYSEDSGSAGQGGDLGFAGEGVFDPAFENALFALQEPGEVSAPVETEFGHHLIQLEEVRENPYPDFDTAREEIETRLRRQQAETLFADKVRELDNLAFEHPNDLAAIAEQLGLEVRKASGVTRQQGPAPFDQPAVNQSLFTDDVLRNGFNSPAVQYGDNNAVVSRVETRHEPEPIPFDQVAEDLRYQMETEQATTLAQQAQADALEQLKNGDSAAKVADAFDANWQTFDQVRRNATDLPRAVLQAAFDLPRPVKGGKSIGEATLPSGGLAVVTVTQVRDGAPDTLSASELDGMRSFLANQTSNLEFTAFYETLRDEASITRGQ